MNKPSWFETKLTAGNVVTIVFFIFGMGATYATFDGRLQKMEDYRVTRSASTDARFDRIDSTLQAMRDFPFRLSNVEGQVDQITARLDASFARFGERLDRAAEQQQAGFSAMQAELAGVKTSVAVLSQRIDSIVPSKRAEMRSGLSNTAN